MEQPEVTITEITPTDAAKAEKGRKVNLGGRYSVEAAQAEQTLENLMDTMRASSKRVFELSWKGKKIPRGAIIMGKEIGWTQNGLVTSMDGEMIGTYERLEEFGGADRDQQRMMVYV